MRGSGRTSNCQEKSSRKHPLKHTLDTQVASSDEHMNGSPWCKVSWWQNWQAKWAGPANAISQGGGEDSQDPLCRTSGGSQEIWAARGSKDLLTMALHSGPSNTPRPKVEFYFCFFFFFLFLFGSTGLLYRASSPLPLHFHLCNNGVSHPTLCSRQEGPGILSIGKPFFF